MSFISTKKNQEIILRTGIIALAFGLALGASGISSEAGYAGIGPNFLPMLVSAGLFLCGGFLFWEAMGDGFSHLPDADPSDSTQAQPCWSGLALPLASASTRLGGERLWPMAPAWRR